MFCHWLVSCELSEKENRQEETCRNTFHNLDTECRHRSVCETDRKTTRNETCSYTFHNLDTECPGAPPIATGVSARWRVGTLPIATGVSNHDASRGVLIQINHSVRVIEWLYSHTNLSEYAIILQDFQTSVFRLFEGFVIHPINSTRT